MSYKATVKVKGKKIEATGRTYQDAKDKLRFGVYEYLRERGLAGRLRSAAAAIVRRAEIEEILG